MASRSTGLESLSLEVRSVLIPFANGLTLEDFQREARGLLGPNGLPYRKFGYFSLLQMLRDMPEAINVIELGHGEVLLKAILDSKTKHIGDMVRKQKNSSNKQNQNARHLAQRNVQERSRLVTKNIAQTRAIPRTVQNEIISILNRTSPITTDRLIDEYKRRYGRAFEWERYGFMDIPDMMRSLGQVAIANRGTVCQFSLRDAAKRAPRMEDENQNYQPKALTSNVSQRESLMIAPLLARNLAKLLADFPHGLKVDDLNLEYAKKFGTNFDYRESDASITSMLKFCIALPDMFKVAQIDGINYCGPLNAIFPQPKPLPVPEEPKPELKPVTPKQKPSYDSNFDRIKQDALLEEAVHISVQELPIARKLGDAFEILIGEVYNPQKFYFQLRSTSIALDELMDNLSEFYDGPKGADYKLRPVDFLAGQLVAIKFEGDGRWHRGIIQKLRNTCTAQVRFVDFGTVQKERIENLRYLSKAFLSLPAQGILGRVAGIRPLKNAAKWSAAAATRFYSLITELSDDTDEPLLGIFRGVQTAGDVAVSLELVDPARNPPVGLNIGKTLVEEGLASVDPNALVKDRLQVDPFELTDRQKCVTRTEKEGFRKPGQKVVPPPPKDPPKNKNPGKPETMPPSHAFSLPVPGSDVKSSFPVRSSDKNSGLPPILSAFSNKSQLSSIGSSGASSVQNIVLNKNDIDLDSVRITKVALNDQHALHIIELNNLCLATSAGISNLFPWKGRDLLAHFMEMKQLSYKYYSLARNECQKLFSLGLIECVPGFIDQSNDQLVNELHLYRVKDVPFLVKAFECRPDPELLKSLNREISSRKSS